MEYYCKRCGERQAVCDHIYYVDRNGYEIILPLCKKCIEDYSKLIREEFLGFCRPPQPDISES